MTCSHSFRGGKKGGQKKGVSCCSMSTITSLPDVLGTVHGISHCKWACTASVKHQ